MTKNGKIEDELQCGQTSIWVPFEIVKVTWNHDERCLYIKSNFFNADAKNEELNMSVL